MGYALALLLEIGLPLLLVFALWRVWPKDNGENAPAPMNEAPTETPTAAQPPADRAE